MVWRDILLPVVIALVTSSGLWAFLIGWRDKTSATARLLMGLAHNHIIEMGVRAIERGWIYRDEYDDLITYSYGPYKDLGGNGMCDKIIQEVNRLPIRYRYIPTGGTDENRPK